jgi:hypothetical protein
MTRQIHSLPSAVSWRGRRLGPTRAFLFTIAIMLCPSRHPVGVAMGRKGQLSITTEAHPNVDLLTDCFGGSEQDWILMAQMLFGSGVQDCPHEHGHQRPTMLHLFQLCIHSGRTTTCYGVPLSFGVRPTTSGLTPR